MKSEEFTESKSQLKGNRLQIIHQISNQLLDVKEERDIYRIMSDAINQILPGVYFVVTKLQPDDMNFRIMESFGFDKYLNAIKKIIGKDPFTIDFPLKDLSEENIKKFESRRIHQFSGGIYDLVNRHWNKTVCKTIEKLLDISVVCAISFCVSKKYYGGISLFIPKSIMKAGRYNDEVIILIETISNLASASLDQIRDHKTAIQYEAEYKLTQERFKDLVNQLNDIVWMANPDGSEIVDLNNSFEKFFGIPSKEFYENPSLWLEIVHPEDKKIAEKSNADLFEKGNSTSEYRIIKPDGEIRWVRDRKSIVYDQNGKAIQMGGKATDITEQKELEERLYIKHFALNNSPIAVGLADLKGIVFYVNDAYVRLWGFGEKSEVIGKHISEFATDKKQQKKVLATIMQGRNYYGEGKTTRLDGTQFNSLISASFVKSVDGKPICLMAMFVDISVPKRQEKLMKDQNNKLNELVATKDKLYSIISHDLKSPFNAILGLSEILITEYKEMSDEQRLRIIKLFHASSKNAFILLENLIAWSGVQRGKIKIKKESLNVIDLVKESTKPYLLAAIEKEIKINNTISENISILADRNTMRTVIGNIFNNATKFTPRGGEINLSAQKTKNFIEINIKDSGVGMSLTDKRNLFKIDASQSTSGTENEKGTGLGLIICKEFISKNEGKIIIESEKGKGSLFKLIIPDIKDKPIN